MPSRVLTWLRLLRRIAAQTLAESPVTAPDGTVFLVRISRKSVLAVSGLRGASDPVSALAGFAWDNVQTLGRTG